MNKKQSIAILGGSFNPPTKAHVKLAEYVLKQSKVDKIWFMPCYNHNNDKQVIDPFHRERMLDLSIIESKLEDKLQICSFELITKSDGKAFNTVNKLIEMNPNTNFKYVIGLDCALNIKKWYKYLELINTIPFIVVGREGYKVTKKDWTWWKNYPHISLEGFDEISSSTEARKAIADGNQEVMDRLLYKNVIEYIKEYELYDYQK